MREDDDAAVPYCAALGDVTKVPPLKTMILLTLRVMYDCSSVLLIYLLISLAVSVTAV